MTFAPQRFDLIELFAAQSPFGMPSNIIGITLNGRSF